MTVTVPVKVHPGYDPETGKFTREAPILVYDFAREQVATYEPIAGVLVQFAERERFAYLADRWDGQSWSPGERLYDQHW
jgi:hypothetical protein